MKESDLYQPLKHFLESQGYDVKGEVHDCDVLAVREQEAPVIAELKLTLNLTVVLQAVDRLKLSPKVYIGVPSQCKVMKRQGKAIVKLLRMLGLGLMLINPEAKTGKVNIVLDPGEYKPRKSKYRQERLLGEFAKRVGDPNLGGSVRTAGVVTAYRQQAIQIAKYLHKHGPTKASLVAQAVGEPKARGFLYRDVYGWFERLGEGVYGLSPRGRREISTY